MAQAQVADERKRPEIPVDDRTKPEQAARQQLAPFPLDDLEVGQHQQILNVDRRQNVLLDLRHAQPDPRAESQDRLPKMRIVGDDQPRFAMAQGLQRRKRCLAVIQRADRIGKNDVVERSDQASDDRRILDVTENKSQMRVPAARLFEHCRAEVDANADQRLQCGQKIANAASKFENPRALRDEKAHIAAIVLIEISIPLDPQVALARHSLREFAQSNLARGHRPCHCRAYRSVHYMRLFIVSSGPARLAPLTPSYRVGSRHVCSGHGAPVRS